MRIALFHGFGAPIETVDDPTLPIFREEYPTDDPKEAGPVPIKLSPPIAPESTTSALPWLAVGAALFLL